MQTLSYMLNYISKISVSAAILATTLTDVEAEFETVITSSNNIELNMVVTWNVNNPRGKCLIQIGHVFIGFLQCWWLKLI